MPLFTLGAAATRPSELCEDTTAKPLTAHHALLLTAVSQQLGPLAAAVCRALISFGPMSLYDVSEAVRHDEGMRAVAAAAANHDSATGTTASTVPATHEIGTNVHIGAAEMATAEAVMHDAAVKEVMTRLVLHRLVYADTHAPLYGLRLGSALLLRVLFPLLLNRVRQQYGEAAKCVLLAVYQLGLVPPVAAVRLVLSRTPSITREAVEYAVTQLTAEGWLMPVTNGREVDADVSSELWSVSAPYCVSLDAALRGLLSEALEQMIAERYADGGMALALIRTLRRREASSHTGHAAEMTLSAQELASALPVHVPSSNTAGTRRYRSGQPIRGGQNDAHGTAAAAQRCLDRLAQPVLLFSGEASSQSHVPLSAGGYVMSVVPERRPLLRQPQPGFYTLDTPVAIRLLQEAVCERVVFSRFGVLGVRVVKLLLQHHYLEERTLAEQAVATYTKTRDVLHQMFKEGLLRQQEVPRNGAMAERAAKGSTFLWGLSWSGTVLPTVRERLAKSLTIALLKLGEVQTHLQRQEQSLASSVSGSGGDRGTSPGPGNALRSVPLSALVQEASSRPSSAEVEAQWKAGLSLAMQQKLQLQRTVAGLQSCAMALMRLLLLVDYY